MQKLHERLLGRLFYYAKEFWLFVSSHIFLRNFGKMLGILLVLFFMVNWWFSCYTRHGSHRLVGNYTGMALTEAKKKIRKDGFRYVLSDSVFIVDEQPGIVLDQNPKQDAKVKKRRKIYLTITKEEPDLVSLPGLAGNDDYNQYIKKLKLLGVKAKIRESVFDNKLEENTILHFFFEDEKITDGRLQAGVKVPMGTTLEFIVSTRSGGSVELPDLVCNQFAEAEFLITSSGLHVAIDDEATTLPDLQTAYVHRQVPAYAKGQRIAIGDTVRIYLSENLPPNCGGN
jgi:D-alanine-D-alanine ligase